MSRGATLCGFLCVVGCAAPPGVEQQPPTFYADVAPILANRCASCHRDGGVAPFALLTLDDALATPAISDAVTARRMPPWNANDSGECNQWRDSRWLSEFEIATIAEWADGERVPGDPTVAPLPPEPPGLHPAAVTITATLPEPYAANPSLGDDYRCFVVDPHIASAGYLTAFDVRPGEVELVHEVRLYQLDSAAAEATVRELDALSPRPGYSCFADAGADASLLGHWVPELGAMRYPAGTGLAVAAGRSLVVAIHYHVHGEPRPDQTAVDLTIEPTVAAPSQFYRVAAANLYLLPQSAIVTTTERSTLASSMPAYSVHGVVPRMHALGRTLHVEAESVGDRRCVVDAPRWNVDWQQSYFVRSEPLVIAGGDTLEISCTHDTSAIGAPVTAGNRAEDESCSALLYLSPR